jgi:methyl-accepting chemotaxis protein
VEEAQALLDGPLAAAHREVLDLVVSLADAEVRHGQGRYEQHATERAPLGWALGVGLALALIAGARVAISAVCETVHTARHLAAAAERATHAASELAAARDLAQRRSLALEQSNTQLRDAADGIATLALGLSGTAEGQAEQARREAAAVTEVAATLEQLSRTADEIAASAQGALASSERGASAVLEAVTGIEAHNRRVDEVARRIVALGAESQKIGNIADILADIANKIHLLSLNAALEAESAGDHGSRFSAVAQQVKELSRNARQASGEVKSLISRTQAAANSAVMATEQAAKEASRSAELARQSGDVIAQMVARVDVITTATQEQRRASEHVLITTRGLEEIVRQSTLQAQEVASLSTELLTTAACLRLPRPAPANGAEGRAGSPAPVQAGRAVPAAPTALTP